MGGMSKTFFASLIAVFTVLTVPVSVEAHDTVSSCLTLQKPQIRTLPGNARYLLVSGRQDCSSGWEFNAVTVLDGHGQEVKYSTVIPEIGGKVTHGNYFIPVPRNPGFLTVKMEAFTGSGLTASKTVKVAVSSLPDVSTKLNPVRVETFKGERFLQISGKTTGYGTGAVSYVEVVNMGNGETTVNGVSGVKTSKDTFKHGKVFFPVTAGTYKVTARTVNNIPEVTSDTVTVTVK